MGVSKCIDRKDGLMLEKQEAGMQNQEHEQTACALAVGARRTRGCSVCIRSYFSGLKGTSILSKDLFLLHQTKSVLPGSPMPRLIHGEIWDIRPDIRTIAGLAGSLIGSTCFVSLDTEHTSSLLGV